MIDDEGAGWEQQMDNERRRWEEDEALARCRILTEQALVEWREYENWSAQWWKRIAA